MMITLNCGWGVPGEEVTKEKGFQRAIYSLNAAFGIDWIPAQPENDNIPEYLCVVV